MKQIRVLILWNKNSIWRKWKKYEYFKRKTYYSWCWNKWIVSCSSFRRKDAVEPFIIPNSQASFRVDKTLSSLINKLKENLKSTKIILNTSVLNIKKEKDFIEIKSSNNIFKADKVIVAIPPRLCAKIDFFPSLDKKMFIKLSKTHTWMANSCKCVIEFKKAFWKEKQLSGFVFSNQGPLSEIHDASTKDKAALFGFLCA